MLPFCAEIDAKKFLLAHQVRARPSYGRRMVPTASLPSPGEPAFIAFGAGIGAFLGGTVARILGYDADKKMRWTGEGSYYGTGVALCVYMAVNAHRSGAL